MITFFILVAHPQRTIKKKLLHYVITSLIHLNLMPLGKTLQGLKEYIGATILGDGLVTLILDVAALI